MSDLTSPLEVIVQQGITIAALTQRNAELEAEVERLKDVEDAARRLSVRLGVVHNHPAYVSVWTIADFHSGPYRGPQYVNELAALNGLLAAHEPAPETAP